MEVSRTFTVDEAQSLLPVLETLLRRAQDQGRTCAEIEVELDQLRQLISLHGGMNVDVAQAARRRGERDKALQETKDALAEIQAIGVQIKDLEKGLLDFPCLLEGKRCFYAGSRARPRSASGTPSRMALPAASPWTAALGSQSANGRTKS